MGQTFTMNSDSVPLKRCNEVELDMFRTWFGVRIPDCVFTFYENCRSLFRKELYKEERRPRLGRSCDYCKFGGHCPTCSQYYINNKFYK